MSEKNQNINSEEEGFQTDRLPMPESRNADIWLPISVESNDGIVHVTSAMNGARGQCIVRSTVYVDHKPVAMNTVVAAGMVKLVEDAQTGDKNNAIVMGG